MTEHQQLFRQGALQAWYEAAKPALYVNKTIREWLQTYAEMHRPEAVKLALIYGIVCLRKSVGNKALNVEELRQTIENGHQVVTLSEELPVLKEGVAGIQEMLKDFDQQLLLANLGDISEPKTKVGRERARIHKRNLLTTTCEPLQVSNKHLESIPQPIYPSWWGEHPPQPPVQPPKGPEQQPRPPPRLAYSMQQEVRGDPPLHSNDLITTNYLGVPSSGYCVQHRAQPAKRALVWEQSEGKDVSTPGDAQLESGKENHAGHGQRKPLKLKQHIPVKSKVKQQLQQADALHEQRGKARKHRLQTALGPRPPPPPQRFHTLPIARSSDGRYSTDQPATDIADSILSNPWTAALVQDDADMPQLYCNSTALTRVGLGSWAPDQPSMQKCLQNAHKGSPAPEGVAPEVQGARPTEGSAICSVSESGSRGSKHSGRCTKAGSDGDDCNADSPGSVLGNGTEQAGGTDGCNAGSLARQEHGSCSLHKTGLRHTDQLLSDPSSSGTQHQPMSVSNQDDSDTDRVAAQQTKITGVDHWAAAFTSKTGRQQQGAGPQAAAQPGRGDSSSGQGPVKQRVFTSWIGDFGHLDGLRFSKQQGREWQAQMRSQRDQPDAQSESEADPEPMLQQDTQVQYNEEGEEGSERLDKADGRWDFAKILAQDV
ncbi:hypothetical protein WJX79_003109 [Trebouxia sp. C0005]